mmetsp:Transcript_35351/g.114443  ORF Transcript_35351/g.114443 Transcript_35351/m.114443 type:complete len:830 (+) Transcript_35351:96-2585(+)
MPCPQKPKPWERPHVEAYLGSSSMREAIDARERKAAFGVNPLKFACVSSGPLSAGGAAPAGGACSPATAAAAAAAAVVAATAVGSGSIALRAAGTTPATHPQAQAEGQAQAQAHPHPQAQAQAQAQAQVQLQPQPKAQPQVQPQPLSQPQPKVQPNVHPQTQPKAPAQPLLSPHGLLQGPPQRPPQVQPPSRGTAQSQPQSVQPLPQSLQQIQTPSARAAVIPPRSEAPLRARANEGQLRAAIALGPPTGYPSPPHPCPKAAGAALRSLHSSASAKVLPTFARTLNSQPIRSSLSPMMPVQHSPMMQMRATLPSMHPAKAAVAAAAAVAATPHALAASVPYPKALPRRRNSTPSPERGLVIARRVSTEPIALNSGPLLSSTSDSVPLLSATSVRVASPVAQRRLQVAALDATAIATSVRVASPGSHHRAASVRVLSPEAQQRMLRSNLRTASPVAALRTVFSGQISLPSSVSGSASLPLSDWTCTSGHAWCTDGVAPLGPASVAAPASSKGQAHSPPEAHQQPQALLQTQARARVPSLSGPRPQQLHSSLVAGYSFSPPVPAPRPWLAAVPLMGSMASPCNALGGTSRVLGRSASAVALRPCAAVAELGTSASVAVAPSSVAVPAGLAGASSPLPGFLFRSLSVAVPAAIARAASPGSVQLLLTASTPAWPSSKRPTTSATTTTTAATATAAAAAAATREFATQTDAAEAVDDSWLRTSPISSQPHPVRCARPSQASVASSCSAGDTGGSGMFGGSDFGRPCTPDTTASTRASVHLGLLSLRLDTSSEGPPRIRLEEFRAMIESFLGTGAFAMQDARLLFGLMELARRG